MCEESGRQVGGQTDAAEGRAMDRRRDERCDESRDRRPDRHAAGVCLHVFVCVCADAATRFPAPRHLSDSPPTE